MAFSVFQRGDGRGGGQHARPRGHDAHRSRDVRQLRGGVARPRGSGRSGCRVRQAARRCPQDRPVEPEAGVHVAELRATPGRLRRGGDRAEERAWWRHRHERVAVGRPPAARGGSPRRAAPVRAPDRRPQRHAVVRRGRDHPAEAALVRRRSRPACSTSCTARTTHPPRAATRKPRPPCPKPRTSCSSHPRWSGRDREGPGGDRRGLWVAKGKITLR